MKKIGFLIFLLTISLNIFSQDENQKINGKVLNDANDTPIENVHIVNMNQVIGSISKEDGSFSISAKVNDTLYFSYLGFKSIRVRVTNDWFKFGEIKIKMTELGIALEEVVLRPVQLTGYLEVDAKIIPIYDNYRYSISGLNTGYEGGQNQPSAVSKAMSAVFNPADFLYNVFGKRPAQMRKLRQMKTDDNIRNLLQSKFDRETLMVVLQLEKVDIDEILNNCNYSETFIRTANDLQILDAMSECYEEYRVLNRRKN
ncbi:carboxypeptidase-like regulatory domain-containing protein [Planktosalinus lacus]|uniref:Membrane protein n=1 Tax=Planktosalinus lacus TaxID=1526573 RepID=A0A8J2VB28_9FLAO|nr:carboxypeptidase-like regulatory domain-containing protein [Planktosalinus lacus]GGD97385.1 membrane protein [Planktosalinus lacus]